ncbi:MULTISPECIES: multicopper oxidase family protein [Lysobacter]|uniref:multicopper oxidase family protein n=1 Tax=Lysobacter TaxID=68 RepID=UPI001F1F33C9|nr:MULTISPECIES: multicopper oxidase domain-containing protein [Lysobacter]UJB18293.1 multicopper oxidase domain-containing protein [Lysobacter capsici]UJQ27983.1 multicopper oxidase domain-containing protein [Lysobacter gummosus]
MERIHSFSAAGTRLRLARTPLAAAAVACLFSAAPFALWAQDASKSAAAAKLAPRALEQPVLARMLRSQDLKPLLSQTPAGTKPLDTHEAKLDLRIAFTESKIWNPNSQRYDKVKLRSYQSPGTNPDVPFVAPTIVTSPGETVRVGLDNQLPPQPDCHPANINIPHCFNSTNLHSHGLWVSPTGNSDNVLLTLRPGVKFEYEYNLPADHPAGTFWYHPHLHGSTALQVSSGMAGALLVRGDRLPGSDRTGDVDTLLRDETGAAMPERLLMFQQVAYACRGTDGKIKTDSNGFWTCGENDIGQIDNYDDQFGFGVWQKSGRHTSINGTVLPTFNGLVAGRVERWRLLHAGVRDTVNLQLREVDAASASIAGLSGAALDNWVTQHCTGAPLKQFEVASDGLTHAKAIVKTENVLQPGYRSDALVVFPKAAKYCVLDAAAPASASITNAPEDRQLLGIAEVGGAAKVDDVEAFVTEKLVASAKQQMPESVRERVVAGLRDHLRLDDFVPHRTIDKGEINAKGQDVVFNIEDVVEDGKKRTVYMVDGKPYDPSAARDLILGNVEEWRLSSLVGGHPFHIHVNPFQIVSILDDKGKEVSVTGDVDDNGKLVDPQYANLQGTWKDTLFVKKGYHLLVRTRYERYIGEYVLHCHILDHEDQGMMQNVRVLVPDGKGGGISATSHH